ncbi:LOW QUALITY PROTEIN: protein phosphatase 2C-like domain-containing protein 1 [Phoenicopterus ruber ruber]
MTWEEKPQDKTNLPDFELSRAEEDHLEKVTIAPKNDDSPTKTENRTLLAQKLISELTKIPKYSETHRQKTDYSFEVLIDNHTPTSYCDLANINNPSTFQNVNTSLIKALAICQDKNSTWQGDMEDRFIVLNSYGNRSDTCFLGVDGSHGVTAAETAAAALPLLFLDQLAQMDSSSKKSKDEQQILDSFAPVIKADHREKEKILSDKPENDETNKMNTYEWIHKAHAQSFWRTDRLLGLGRNDLSKGRWSGCSVVTCWVERISREETDGTEEEDRRHSENNTRSPLPRAAKGVAELLHIANIGNAHAVLCKNRKSHYLSKEHSTSNVSERKRILQNGGISSTNEPDRLVEGYLRTTKDLGCDGHPVLKRSVIPATHTVSVPINDTCQFLILASNGLWEVLDYNKVHATQTTFTHYLRMYECVQQNGTSPFCQYLMPLTEDNLNESKAINDLQDGTEILYSNKDIFLTDSKGILKQNKPKCSRRNYLQSEDGVPKDTDDHKNQADPELSLFSNNEVNSQNREIKQSDSSAQGGSEELKQFEDREVYLCNSFQPQSQTAEREETGTDTFCATGLSCPHEQLRENVLAIGSKDMKQPPKDTKACLSNYHSGPQLPEKMDSKIFSDKPASYAAQELLKTVSPVGSKPPPFEEDTKTYPSNCESQTAGRSRVTSATPYNNAASYISEQLVKTALAAGSRDNITILIVLLNGCNKIPNYLNI